MPKHEVNPTTHRHTWTHGLTAAKEGKTRPRAAEPSQNDLTSSPWLGLRATFSAAALPTCPCCLSASLRAPHHHQQQQLIAPPVCSVSATRSSQQARSPGRGRSSDASTLKQMHPGMRHTCALERLGRPSPQPEPEPEPEPEP